MTPEDIFRETFAKYWSQMMGQAFAIIFLILLLLMALAGIEFWIKWNETKLR